MPFRGMQWWELAWDFERKIILKAGMDLNMRIFTLITYQMGLIKNIYLITAVRLKSAKNCITIYKY